MGSQDQIIRLDGIADVRVVHSGTARYIRISVRTYDDVRLTVPKGSSIESATKFLHTKINWVKEKVQQAKNNSKRTIFDKNTVFETKYHKMRFIESRNLKVSIHIGNGNIDVLYPSGTDLRVEKYQKFIRKGIYEVWKLEAKNVLPKRLDELAKKFNFKYTGLKITGATTRWGSCTGRNTINLSYHLMRLPYHLIDYVMMHELGHTIEKNHGTGFWALLDKFYNGKSKKVDKQLNNFHIGVF